MTPFPNPRRSIVRARVGFPIAAKFAVMLAAMVVALVVLSLAGLRGLQSLRGQTDRLYSEHVLAIQLTASLSHDASRAARFPLEVLASKPSNAFRLEEEFNDVLLPQVKSDIARLRAIHAHDSRSERAQIEQIAEEWARLSSLKRPDPSKIAGSRGIAAIGGASAAVRALQATFAKLEQQISKQTSLEATQAAEGASQAQATYRGSRTLVLVIGALAMLIGAGIMAMLVRAIVPRVRRYSDFARRVAVGDADSRVAVTGRDELGELGTALNEMVDQRVKERAREDAQLEFAEVMQLTDTEEEAHQLLVRQIERLIPDSSVLMLNRNNSADRLEATTAVPEGSPLARALNGAKPRSCLAVRFARTHSEQPECDALITCGVCGGVAAFSTCEPLLVGGEVIGSVLASHPRQATDADAQSIKRSVTQAAPVLANLRNLAIAETRAKTDGLTGLPNKRNVTDTVRRMVAHASRAVSPLAALALDLDHFKEINDRYGHGTGDEALAAVGAALTGSCRESDFVGRVGGEEFLVLLPDTGLQAAQVVAESIRAAVAAIVMPTIERAMTVSIGIAVLPDHAGDSAQLLRNADRALYAAKNNGRNRAETFTRDMLSESQVPPGGSPSTRAVAGV